MSHSRSIYLDYAFHIYTRRIGRVGKRPVCLQSSSLMFSEGGKSVVYVHGWAKMCELWCWSVMVMHGGYCNKMVLKHFVEKRGKSCDRQAGGGSSLQGLTCRRVGGRVCDIYLEKRFPHVKWFPGFLSLLGVWGLQAVVRTDSHGSRDCSLMHHKEWISVASSSFIGIDENYPYIYI